MPQITNLIGNIGVERRVLPEGPRVVLTITTDPATKYELHLDGIGAAHLARQLAPISVASEK